MDIKTNVFGMEDNCLSSTSIKRVMVIVPLLIMFCFPLVAQTDLIGAWKSKSIKEGTETVYMELTFRDSVNMQMAFVTDNRIPNVGRCLSRISVQGTYKLVGPIFLTEIIKKSLNIRILKLELAGDMAKNTPTSMIPKLKEQLKQQISQSAMSLFSNYDGGSMIYVTHKDKNDVISFIMGDETNAIDMEFSRIKDKKTY